MSHLVEMIPRERLGPVLIAAGLNTFFYGICFIQFTRYLKAQDRDIMSIRLVVYWVFAIDTVHTAVSEYLLWNYTVDDFGDANDLKTNSWAYISTPMFISLVACPVQAYFASLTLRLGGSWYLFGLILLLSISSAVLGVATSLIGFVHPAYSTSTRQFLLINVGLGVSTACDILIGLSLSLYLLIEPSGKGTDTLISYLVHVVVETSALTSIVSLIDIIVFNTTRTNDYHCIVGIPIGRIYTIALLCLLNSRQRERKGLDDGVEMDTRHTKSALNRQVMYKPDDGRPNPMRGLVVRVKREIEVAADPFNDVTTGSKCRDVRASASCDDREQDISTVLHIGKDEHCIPA